MYADNLNKKLIVTPTENKFTVFIAFSAMTSEELLLPDSFDDMKSENIKEEYMKWYSEFDSSQTNINIEDSKYRKTADLAKYILWSSTVSQNGNITTDTVMMSKNYMHYVWAWDHCFNALALVEAHPELAWQQMLVFFNKQYENGMLPDRLFPLGGSFNCTKPPIHGWCVNKLLDKGLHLPKDEMEAFYMKLKKWTNWWFEKRDDNKDGICQYNWNNESGYDNASIFDMGLPVDAPDLSAYLVLQLKCLARIADILGKTEECEQYHAKSDTILEKMISHFWKDEQFVSIHHPSKEIIESKCLANLTPLVLGDLLPKNQLESLVNLISVEYDYLTPYGLATEAISSKAYNVASSEWDHQHTYWRGSIWAPLTYLIIDGLKNSGEMELAKKIAVRFCDMVNGKDGIYENYAATTGEGQCDPSYTWTYSVFLLLLNDFELK